MVETAVRLLLRS